MNCTYCGSSFIKQINYIRNKQSIRYYCPSTLEKFCLKWYMAAAFSIEKNICYRYYLPFTFEGNNFFIEGDHDTTSFIKHDEILFKTEMLLQTKLIELSLDNFNYDAKKLFNKFYKLVNFS